MRTWLFDTLAGVLLAMVALSLTVGAVRPALAQPRAYLAHPVHHASGVVEGQILTHEFILENRGDAPLEVVRVDPG